MAERRSGGDIPLVISNHPDLRPLVDWYGIEFRHIPFGADRKAQAFDEVASLFDAARRGRDGAGPIHADPPGRPLLPLPAPDHQYPPQLLPSFAGARPYHQAFERGVKLIGATCHYVTDELDAGPIIEQDTIRIDHADSVPELLRIGRGIERAVLAHGLRWHLEDRVLVNGNRTVVFT